MRFIPVLIAILLFISCEQRAKLGVQREVPGAASEVTAGLFDKREVSFDEIVVTDDQPKMNLERKLIRNGNINFKTKNVKDTKSEIEKLCKASNAYISNETQNDYDNSLSYTQKIRVPADHFDELLQKIEQLASHVDNRSLSSEDVTEEYIDVETRLSTKRELEKRYKDILSKAHSVEDLLSVEREMNNVRSEIESMQGRLNYLKNQVAFSTLDVTFYEEKSLDFGFASRLVRSLGEGWDNLLYFLIGLLSLWPFVILIGGGLWFFMRYRRKKRAQA